MVRSISSETVDSESNQNPYRQIIHEFYSERSVCKRVTTMKIHSNLIKFIQESVLANKKRSVNASDRLRTTQHLILTFVYKKYRKFVKDRSCSNVNEFFSDTRVSKLFPLLLKVLFSYSPKYLCSRLKIRCCTSSNHFSFCKFKWRALQNYFIHELYSVPDTEALSSNSLTYLISEIFHN